MSVVTTDSPVVALSRITMSSMLSPGFSMVTAPMSGTDGE